MKTSEDFMKKNSVKFELVEAMRSDFKLPCFVSGHVDPVDLQPCIIGYVENEKAGARIVAMFDGLARLGYPGAKGYSPFVSVGSSGENEEALRKLYVLIKDAGDSISPAIIAEAKKGFAPSLAAKKQKAVAENFDHA